MIPELDVNVISGKEMNYFIIKLTNLRITGITSSSDCNPQCEIREEVTFNYDKIGWEYTGKDGSKTQAGWDVMTNRKM